jgi:hypothetical protein
MATMRIEVPSVYPWQHLAMLQTSLKLACTDVICDFRARRLRVHAYSLITGNNVARGISIAKDVNQTQKTDCKR